MSRYKTDKKIPVLEPFFENILVCNDKRLRPYIEIFVSEPENVSQQRLGNLMGILEIEDDSEDSSYIVNYLISIIKKEYFSRPKSGPIESFETALHKANLALSKLAEHGSIKWIGKLNVLVALIEKNNLHVAQTGSASAFLLRSNSLTDISEGLSQPGVTPNPLKTFVNVSSGKLEKNDKVIITTENIFDIFSFDEIKKSAIRFSNEQFAQFLRTALVNELDKAATLVVDIKEKDLAPAPASKKPETLNAFSQAAFYGSSKSKKVQKQTTPEIHQPDKKTNEKNGHLYINENDELPAISTSFADHMDGLMEKIIAIGSWFGKSLGSLFVFIKEGLASGFKWLKIKIFSKNQSAVEKPESATAASQNIDELLRSSDVPLVGQVDESSVGFLAKIKKFWKGLASAIIEILPKFSRIRNAFSNLSWRQKIYALLAILIIIVLPLLVNRTLKLFEPKKPHPIAEEPLPVVIPLEQDKNVVRLENVSQLYTGTDIIATVELNKKAFAVMQGRVIDLESQELFVFPENFGKIDLVCSMADLNLIFAINKESRKIIAWSPTSKKFQSNNIEIPAEADISAAGTYLTYLYLIDVKNDKTYRYPRAEGGFGAKTEWLKEEVDISSTVGIAINENLFLADENKITKLLRGKVQDFKVEETATPISPFKLWTKRNVENLYVLDHDNARIIKLDKDGKILNQYYHPDIGNAIDFIVEIETSTIYFNSAQSVQSFNMP